MKTCLDLLQKHKMLRLIHGRTLVDIMIVMEENDMELSQSRKEFLEDSIRSIINENEGAVYTGSLEVVLEDGIYTLSIWLNSNEFVPFTLSFQGSEDDFLKYIQLHLKKKRFSGVKRTITTLINDNTLQCTTPV